MNDYYAIHFHDYSDDSVLATQITNWDTSTTGNDAYSGNAQGTPASTTSSGISAGAIGGIIAAVVVVAVAAVVAIARRLKQSESDSSTLLRPSQGNLGATGVTIVINDDDDLGLQSPEPTPRRLNGDTAV